MREFGYWSCESALTHVSRSVITPSQKKSEEKKMMEADVQGDYQAMTVAVVIQDTMAFGSTPAPVCGGEAAET